jgi:hypothetical protein
MQYIFATEKNKEGRKYVSGRKENFGSGKCQNEFFLSFREIWRSFFGGVIGGEIWLGRLKIYSLGGRMARGGKIGFLVGLREGGRLAIDL